MSPRSRCSQAYAPFWRVYDCSQNSVLCGGICICKFVGDMVQANACGIGHLAHSIRYICSHIYRLVHIRSPYLVCPIHERTVSSNPGWKTLWTLKAVGLPQISFLNTYYLLSLSSFSTALPLSAFSRSSCSCWRRSRTCSCLRNVK